MNKLLQSLILTSTILTAGEVIGKNNEIIESKSSFTKKETTYFVNQLLKKNNSLEEKRSIRGYEILNPGGKINDDIRKTIFEIAKIVDEYISENLSLKGSTNNQGKKINTIETKTGSRLELYYKIKF